MERNRQKQLVEALIVAAPAPLGARQLAEIVPRLSPADARALVLELAGEYDAQQRGVELWEVAGGYQVRTRQEFAPWVRQLLKERALRLSRAALETLAVVAYRQPCTRAEIEEVRGVEAGPMLRSLVERNLVRIAGHRDVPGRPLNYATTRRFLEVFGLARIEDLPTLREAEDFMPATGEQGVLAAEALTKLGEEGVVVGEGDDAESVSGVSVAGDDGDDDGGDSDDDDGDGGDADDDDDDGGDDGDGGDGDGGGDADGGDGVADGDGDATARAHSPC